MVSQKAIAKMVDLALKVEAKRAVVVKVEDPVDRARAATLVVVPSQTKVEDQAVAQSQTKAVVRVTDQARAQKVEVAAQAQEAVVALVRVEEKVVVAKEVAAKKVEG